MHFISSLKPFLEKQPVETNQDTKSKQQEKVNDVVMKGYIYHEEAIKSYTKFFSVPKVDNIRMVYDGSISGLNLVIWVPPFPLTTVDSVLRSVEPGTWMGALDIGECFLNFNLHEDLVPLCGVDLSDYCDGTMKGLGLGRDKLRSMAWVRCAMGLWSSPYHACWHVSMLEEVIRGIVGIQTMYLAGKGSS